MKEKHIAKTNLLIFTGHLSVWLFITIGLVSQMAMTDMPKINSLLPMAVEAVVSLGAIVMYIKYSKNILFTRYIAVGFSVVYTLMMLFAASGSPFPYMLPYLLCMVISLDKFSAKVTGVTFAVVNVIRVIMTLSGAADVTAVVESTMIEAIITLMVTLGEWRGVTHLNRFFEDSMKEITETSEKNDVVAKRIVEVAATVEAQAEAMAGDLQVISDATKTVSDSMDNISAGTANTAEAIVQQTQQTQDIQGILDDTRKRTNTIVDLTKTAKDALTSGTKAMDSLFGQVSESIENSKTMEETASQLQEKSNEVRGITSIILGISSQTNLLALNASIEAARAGEAGRGFAVVAEEIRKLAEQTRHETENITALIDALSENAKLMMDKVTVNVANANEENAAAGEASKRFEEITDSMNGLAEQIKEVDAKMDSLVEANNAIVDSVNTLSATSEEISASTQEACVTSDKNVTLVKKFADAMENILQQMEKLQQHAE